MNRPFLKATPASINVIPAQAGTPLSFRVCGKHQSWAPAFAGVTDKRST